MLSALFCHSARLRPLPARLRPLLTPPPLPRFFPATSTLTMRGTPSSDDGKDLIFVRGLNLKAVTGVDGWQRPKPQPILLSLWLRTSVALAGSTDHLPHSIHYGLVCKAVTQLVESGGHKFRSLEHLAEDVAQLALGQLTGEWVKIMIEKPRALLRADAAGIEIVRKKVAGAVMEVEGKDRVFIKNLRCVTILGVNPWEREDRQHVIVNLVLHKPNRSSAATAVEFDPHYDFRTAAKKALAHIEASSYLTVEAFVTEVAKALCLDCGIEKVTVRAEKPSALTFAKAAGVEVTRERSFFAVEAPIKDGEKGTHDVFLALGSNLGERLKAINDAVAELDKRGLKVTRTSSLYQSAPMYVEDQPTFLNGVCQIETTLLPEDLLKEVKDIEKLLGRTKTFENGPRSIDLDILLYDGHTMKTPELTIPHASMLEREFVLRPLCDIAPNRAHPLTSTSFKNHLATLPTNTAPLQIYAPFSRSAAPLDPLNPQRPTLVMAVLNLTPDSFSDGGIHSAASIVPTAQALIAAGAAILDIGGQSTRPGAPDVGEAEELSRVLPAIQALRAAGLTVPISVDTYRASVARAAVAAGATLINDVSAGVLDPAMLPTVAELGVPIVLMHTRGTPETMNSLAVYGDLLAEVRAELAARVLAAQEAGVRRWNIILDPGLGFAKNMPQNLELVRRLGELTAAGGEKERVRKEEEKGEDAVLAGLPWLLGPSRKRFVGTATGVEKASERTWGTAGAVAACVAGGADIVRVHDVHEMKMVVDMACAIWRA